MNTSLRSTADRRRAAGFTLVELLVATGLTLALVAVVVAVAQSTLTTWRRANGRLVAQNRAQLALDALARDLTTLTWRRDGRQWLVATVQPDQGGEGEADAGQGGAPYFADWNFPGVAKPGWSGAGGAESSQRLAPASGRIGDARFGQAGVWLRFFARPADASDSDPQNASSVRAVSYQILRRRIATTDGAAHASPRGYALFRSEVRPFHANATTAVRSTFRVGFDLAAAPYWNPAALIPGSTQSAGSGEGEPGGLRRPDRAQVLAEGVVDFGVRFHARDASGGWRLVFPADAAGTASEGYRAFVATADATALPGGSAHPYAGETSRGFPEAAEVMVRVLTDDGAAQLAALEAGRAGVRPPEFAGDAAWWWAVVERNSEVFTRWIALGSRPL